MFADGFEYYSKMNVVVPSDKSVCYSSECAISLALEYNAQMVVTSKIRVLGTKIIFTGMIQDVDGNNQFTTRITIIFPNKNIISVKKAIAPNMSPLIPPMAFFDFFPIKSIVKVIKIMPNNIP